MKTNIKIDLLVADPNNPRQGFDLKQMAVLKSSISTKGILQPITVEKIAGGKFLIIDGERRYRAAKMLGLKEVPVTILEEMSELERFSTRYHIQEQHASWSPFDKAKAISLFKTATGMDINDISELLGMPKALVSDYISLLSLSKRAMKFSNERKLPFKMISALALLKKRVKEVNTQEKLEESMLKKIEVEVITSSEDITIFQKCINFLKDNKVEQNKLIKQIIGNVNFSPEDAAKATDIGDYVNQRKVVHQCVQLNTYISRASKARYTLSPHDHKAIEKVIKNLKSFAENASE